MRQMLAKGRDLIWVIPNGLASTMDNFRKYPEPNSLGRLADWCYRRLETVDFDQPAPLDPLQRQQYVR